MSRIFIGLAILILLVSGCVTTGANLESPAVQQLQARITYLETEIKKHQNENSLLIQQLTEAQKKIESLSTQQTVEKEAEEKIVVKMPNAKDIQQALKNAKFYKGEIDGQIGSQTKEAIKKFQEANGLNPDGVVGSRTWELLLKYLKTESQ